MSSNQPSRSSTRDATLDVARDAERRVDEIGQLRRLPDDLAKSLIETGVFRLWVAKPFGGNAGHPHDLFDIVEGAAYHDASLAWVIAVCGTASRISGVLGHDWSKSIFSDPLNVLAGFAGPGGTGVLEPDGLRVTGTWPWGSGTPLCSHVGGTVRIVDRGGAPAQLPDGNKSVWAVFERAQIVLEDNWDTDGLRGTASGNYAVQDALVPAGRWVSSIAAPAVIDDPLFRFAPVGSLAAGIACVTLGIARRAIDEMYAFGPNKRPHGSNRSLSERPAVQGRIAQVEGGICAAKSFLWDATQRAYDEARNGSPSDAARRALRLAATNATGAAMTAVDACHLAAGGSSIWRGHPLLRLFHDVHVASQHAAVAPATYEVLGRMGFGLETDTTNI